MEEAMVVIVGAGPAGLAVSACLNRLGITNLLLEREDCYASLWKKRTYDQVKLHLAKTFCQLPHFPFPSDAPTFIPRTGFLDYLDGYVASFGVKPLYNRHVESAEYGVEVKKWRVEVKNVSSGEFEVYLGRFLVVATGENSRPVVPNVAGLDSFQGEYMHSSEYRNGRRFGGKDVLVVGCGNSGMEIAYDLSNSGAQTSVVVRNPVHILNKEIVFLGMSLLKLLPYKIVDSIVLTLSNLWYGDTSKYGFQRPVKGPFYLKATTGRSPTIDVGTFDKIRQGDIQVLPSISSIDGNKIKFSDGNICRFNAIIFATGYKSAVKDWLKGGDDLFNGNGIPLLAKPHHWKGENGLYCAGFSRSGLFGISRDAENIAGDIYAALK